MKGSFRAVTITLQPYVVFFLITEKKNRAVHHREHLCLPFEVLILYDAALGMSVSISCS